MGKNSVEDVEQEAEWASELHNLSTADLEKLEPIFKKATGANGEQLGLSEGKFQEALCTIHDNDESYAQSAQLFAKIAQVTSKNSITWNDFLDFLIANIYPETKQRLHLTLETIQPVAHTKSESVAKVVLIDTEQYFCYALVLKHGRVGLYDGNFNFLTFYHAIMTREDLTRPEDERRRRNRWVTDAIFCPDTLMFILTNTARSVIIYEASGLKHVPYWLILSTPNILECLAYRQFSKQDGTSSTLFSGDSQGHVMSFTFLQPKNGLLRRKRDDQLTLFYWNDFLKEDDYVAVKRYGKVHGNSVKSMKYIEESQLLISCSKDPNASVLLKHIESKNPTMSYKVPKGANCFAFSPSKKLLVVGNGNGILQLWNTFISQSIATFSGSPAGIVDVQIMDSQMMILSCSSDGVLRLWCLKECTCLQKIKLKFPCFGIEGKTIEWGLGCIYPGPKRKSPQLIQARDNEGDFEICDVDEKTFLDHHAKTRCLADIWERSNVLVPCCNFMAILRANFSNASIEYGFTYPIVPAPPLQNSVLIPENWSSKSEFPPSQSLRPDGVAKKQLEDLGFILNKNLLEEAGARSDINYKIAVLETQKEKMRSKVALGSPYLALTLPDIQPLKLAPDVSIISGTKRQKYAQKIENLLQDAGEKDEIFSFSVSSSASPRSNRSSVVEIPY